VHRFVNATHCGYSSFQMTECYLQVTSPTSDSECPFCKSSSFGVIYSVGAQVPLGTVPMAIPSVSATTSPTASAASTPETRPASAPSSTSSNTMTPESRLQLEAQMRHQRDDCLTSESYAPSAYARSRSGSYGGGGGGSSSRQDRDSDRTAAGLYSRRHSQNSRGTVNYRGAARHYDQYDDDRLDLFSTFRSEEPAHNEAFERHMRAANLRRRAERESGSSRRSGSGGERGGSRSRSPRGGLHSHLSGRANINDGGSSSRAARQGPGEGDLEQLEEMLLMEVTNMNFLYTIVLC
jgi:hypothetical protein